MNLYIDKKSELTAYEQLREQIIFLISTGEIRIGDEMPSVRAVARQLGVSLNTVSKVYSGLVRGGWLIEHPGAHHKVVGWKCRSLPQFSGSSLDELIDHTIELAIGNGFSLQELAAHVRKRLVEQSPDHLLIVEPDPGIGELMQEEIGTKTGYRPETCSLAALQRNESLAIGALLIAPLYLVESLSRLAAVHRARIIGVSYSPLDTLIGTIARLSQPSMIGWVSVSAAGLKTVSGMAAPAISNRHSSHLFLLETAGADESGEVTVRRFRVGDYRPSDILKPLEKSPLPTTSAVQPRRVELNEIVSGSDLRCMDLLFLDSVAARYIRHPSGVEYRLLSESSLELVKSAAKSLG